MQKKILIFLIPILFCDHSFSQSTAFADRVNYIFQPTNRSAVSTGLLMDYGIDFNNITDYTGVTMVDSNYVNMDQWRSLYASIYSYQFNTNISLPEMNIINNKIDSLYISSSVAIPIVALHYNYEKLRNDAVSAGLVTISNDQIYDVAGRTQSPYQTKTVFAITPVQNEFRQSSIKFVFKPELFYSNTGKNITNIQVDYGSGYTGVIMNTPFTIAFSTSGNKELKFKVTYNDGSIFYSHALITVDVSTSTLPNARYVQGMAPVNITATKPYNDALGSATIQVMFGNNNTSGKIKKPLIVVENMDPWKLLYPKDPNMNYTVTSFLAQKDNGGISTNTFSNTLLKDELEAAGYDIVFVDFTDGLDYIQRNAFVVEEVIKWVNQQKVISGSIEKNVIMGLGTGAVVARYALRDMEITLGTASHNTRLYISMDGPHQGFNIPVGSQLALNAMDKLSIRVGLPLFFHVVNVYDYFPGTNKYIKVFGSPVYLQLMNYNQFSTIVPEMTNFLNEYKTIGYPISCRNIAISNGSECGKNQGYTIYSYLIRIKGSKGYSYLQQLALSYVASFLGPYTNLLTNTVLQFWLAPFSTKTSLEWDFWIKSLPDKEVKQVYNGQIYVRRVILWSIVVYSYVCGSEGCYPGSSTSSMIPLDNNGGGTKSIIPANIVSLFPSYVSNVTELKENYDYLPTYSALDIGGGNISIGTPDLSAKYSNKTPPAPPKNVPFNNFISAGSDNESTLQFTKNNGTWLLNELKNTPVNVDCSGFCAGSYTITGSQNVCSNNETYSVTNFPNSYSSFNWTVSPSTGIVNVVGSTTSSQITLSPVGSGEVTLNATISSICGSQTINLTRKIWVGTPTAPSIQPYNYDAQCGTFLEAYCTEPTSATGYIWNLNFGQVIQDQDGNFTNYFYISPLINNPRQGQRYFNYLSVQAKNICGVSATTTKQFNVGPVPSSCGNGGPLLLVVSPNPTSSSLNVSLSNGKEIKQIRIVDKVGAIRKQFSYASGGINIILNIADLSADLYNIQAFDGVNWVATKFIKN
ncbi:MAG: hypothetical protein HY252_06150 [Sphingobacteriales bacterium]|nr:hypothetical protein [Sphingobacteriales bacterium]